MLIILSALSVATFMAAFFALRIADIAKDAINAVVAASAVMRDPSLDDLDREIQVQRAGLCLIRFAGSLILRAILALAISTLPVFLADIAGYSPWSETLQFMERWDVIAITFGVVLVIWIIGGRLWRK